jgi:hypothetical protein
MSAQASVLPISPVMAGTNARRTRVLAIILMAVIASIFWIDSRYPALMKRYNAGTHVKASGALTFGGVYQVTRDLPPARSSMAHDNQLARCQPHWHDILLSLRARRAHVPRDASEAPNQFAFPEHYFRCGRRSSACGMYQLHCAHPMRAVDWSNAVTSAKNLC